MRKLILQTLQKIIQERSEKKIEPAHATMKELKEILQIDQKTIIAELRAMHIDGLIKAGQPINGTWIQLATQ